MSPAAAPASIRRRAAALACAIALGAGAAVLPRVALADTAPTDEQILKALQKKRVTRCPQLDAGCGGENTAASAIHAEVTFALGSATLSPAAQAALVQLREALARRPPDDRILLVTGHADARGNAIYNQDLSERRAAAVKRWLMINFELRSTAVRAVGFGSTLPKNPGDPYADDNRRVEVGLGSGARETAR